MKTTDKGLIEVDYINKASTFKDMHDNDTVMHDKVNNLFYTAIGDL